MKNTRIMILLWLVSLLFLLSGCRAERPTDDGQALKQVTEYQNTDEKPQSGGTLRLAMTGATSLNPLLADNQNNLYVLGLIFDSLFTVAPDDSIEPVLCETYSIAPDGLHYEFIVKSGVGFHNGASLTAHDVDATLTFLQGQTEFFQSCLQEISEHRADGMTLYVTLRRPVINFPALMTFPVLSAADIAQLSENYVPNGTGRYKVQSYQKSKMLFLSANENYHAAFEPYITNIEVSLLKDNQTAVTMLENLQIDLLPSEVIRLDEYTPKRNLSSAEFYDGDFTFLGLNNQSAALLSSATRSAIAACLDKGGLMTAATVKYAEKADLPFLPRSGWYDNHLAETAYDADSARALLQEDGWQEAEAGAPLVRDVYGETVALNLEILVNEENQTRMRLASQVKEYLSAVGISSYITAVPFAEYEKRVETRQFDLMLGSVSLSANYDLSFLFKTDQNAFGISIEELDQTLNALALQESTAQKQSLFYELCSVLKSEMPMIGLYVEYDTLVFDSRLKGNITPTGTDIFYGIEQWFLSQ